MADAAISSLARAIDGESRTAEQIRNDADLEILRGRADFENLVVRKKAAEEATALAQRGDSGSIEEKLKNRQAALAARAKLVSEDPRSVRNRTELAASQYAVGEVLGDLGRFVEAEKNLKDALIERETLAKDEPKNVRSRLDVGWTHLALGTVHWKAVRLDLADREWTTGLRGMETAIRGEPEDTRFWNELTNAWIQVADKLLQLGLLEKADELLDHAFRRKPASLAINNGHYWYVHAMLESPPATRRGSARFARNSSTSSRTTKANSTSTEPAGPGPAP